MPSSNAMRLATQIKEFSLSENRTNVLTPNSLWFLNTPSGVREISFDSIAQYADEEYEEWRTIDPVVTHECDSDTKLRKWLDDTPVDEIAELIDRTPEGVGRDVMQFTAWQRLSMAFYVFPMFSRTSTIKIDTETLRTVAGYNPSSLQQRKQPLQATFSIFAGAPPKIGIIDLPPGCWKTAWSLSVAFMMLRPAQHFQYRSQYMDSKIGSIFQGPVGVPVARLAIVVASSASTFDHFRTTLTSCIFVWERMEPNLKFVVWDTCGKRTSVLAASQYPSDTVVFWVIPPGKLKEVLRASPEVAVAVLIADEYTVETPREKSRCMSSNVLNSMITQATPQALQLATHGNRSWLKDVFGGALCAPNEITKFVRYRQFTQAQLACEQACMLDLMTLSFFRKPIRYDLMHLLPPSLMVYFVKSKRRTLSSLLMNTEVDMVPATLANVLYKCVRTEISCIFNFQSIQKFRETVSANVLTPDVIADALKTLLADNETVPFADVAKTKLDRLMTKVTEFSRSCPICFEENRVDVRIFGCCGYCVCQRCFESCRSRCAFCRTEVPNLLSKTDVELVPSESRMLPHVSTVEGTFHDALTRATSPMKDQFFNFVSTLYVAQEKGYKRLLILIESVDVGTQQIDKILKLEKVQDATGVRIHRIDHILTGKGGEFTHIKRAFDTNTSECIALLSYGMRHDLLVGTNLDHVDMIVSVGAFGSSIMTQSVHRVFRPRASRDNTVPIAFVKIYS